MQILRRGETLSSIGGTGYQGSYFWLHELPVGAVLLAGIVTEMTPGHDRHAAPEFNFLTQALLVFQFVYFYIFGMNAICISPPLVFLFVYFVFWVLV